MNNIWCILIPILAAIIGAILGWLLRNLTCGCDDEKNEIEKLKAKNNKLEADLKACLSRPPERIEVPVPAPVSTNLGIAAAEGKKEIEKLKAENSKLEANLKACLSRPPERIEVPVPAPVSTDLGIAAAKDKEEIEKLKAENSKLDADLKACLSRPPERIEVPVPAPVSTNLGITSAPTEPVLNFDAAAAKAAIGKKVIADDLKVVEGIGPKIEQLFHDHDIKTWYQLSKAPISKCQEVLNSGGKRYEIHNPSTWPMQSGLAFEGKWEELNTLQDRLDGGVDRG